MVTHQPVVNASIWPVQGYVDSELSYCRRPFEVRRAHIAKGGMPPGGIVKAFDVIEHVGARRVPGRIVFAMGAFGPERVEETFHH